MPSTSVYFVLTSLSETALVIEHVDVIEQQLLGVRVAFRAFAGFALHGREPALHGGVVVAVASSAHAARDAVPGEARPIVFTRVRAALIRMMEQAGLRAASLDCHIQGAECEMAIVHRPDRPSQPRSASVNAALRRACIATS